jgi:exopolysaccharide biosynthesis polyprenyl glycosylphosphotransferase
VTPVRVEANQTASIPPQVIRLARVVGAILAVLISFEVWLRVLHQPPNHLRLWLILIGLLAGLTPAHSVGPRPSVARRLRGVGDVLVAALCTFGTAAGVAWIADQRPPTALIFLILGSTTVLISVCRRLVERLGAVRAPVRSYLVYGHNDLGMAVARFLAEAGTAARIVGFIDDEGAGPLDNHATPVPVFRDLDELAAANPDLLVDGVIIAKPGATAEEVASIRVRLRRRIPNVLLAPPVAVLTGQWPIEHEEGAPHFYLLGVKAFSFDVRLMKRAIDVVVASIALVVFAPVMLLVIILIKLESPGPAIFRQRRFTTDGQLFDCYKLRTMRQAPAQAQGRIELTQRGDSRVTRVGRFLRRTSLDEIPQFINVLQGHMSVVGPRPHPPGVEAAGRTYEDIVMDFADRYKVKPGLTGFAQISGLRGNTFTEEDVLQRFRYDIDYIANWSLALEFWIIIKTFSNGFWGRNAF